MATNTAASFTNHTGNGTAGPFSISFSYLSEAEVDVTVGGVLKTITTHYTFSSATQITFTSGNEPGNGVAIKFQRDTDISAKKVDFQDGSVLTETDLDTNADQVIFAQQEIIDKLGGIEEGATGDQTAAEIRTLVESASDSNVFTDADHSKLNAIEASATADQTAAEIRTLVESASDSNVFTDADHTKLNGIEASATADQTAAEIRTLVESATDSNVFTDADHTKLNGIEAGATADQTVSEIKSLIAGSPLDATHLAANSVDSSELVDGSVDTSHLSADCVDGTKIADNAIGSEHLQANSVTTSEIADAELTTLAGMQSGTASKLADSTALTSDIADLNQLDGMAKQTTITDDDTKFPTSGAVVDFVAAQIAPIGGLEVIANEDSFPSTQPSSGVVISISDIEGLIVNGSGVATNARTTGNGSDNVTINGFPSSLQSKTMAAGLGLMVSSTGSSQTYTYHKLLAKEADVEQLSNDINDFAARYRVGSSNPTTDLDAGDLFFNTSTQKLLVYNSTNSAWEEAQSIGNFFISTFSESFDGSRTDFTVSNAPANAQQIILSINGVVQKPNSGTSTPSEGFALSGSTVKLSSAPASGSDVFIVVMGSTVNIGTPSNNTVSSSILQNGSVIEAKLADSAITNAKVNASAAIAGSKISPDFGSQAITTTGNLNAKDIILTDTDPSITFTDSDNNPDYRIFANAGRFKLKDTTNNVERVTLDSSGNVGIGTASPNYLFEVEAASGDAQMRINAADSSAGNDAILRLQIAGTTQNNFIYFGDGDDSNAGQIRYSHSNNFLSFTTNAAERMRIDSSGDVGIGTSSPANVLDVQGSSHSKILIGTTGTAHATGIQITHADGNSGEQQWQLQTDASADGNLVVRNATTGNKIMIFDSDVYGVSIGGIDPEKLFELQSSNNGITDATEARNTLRFRCNDSTTATNQPFGTILWTTNDSGNSSGKAAFITATDVDSTGNGQLLFGTGNPAAERMRILGNGRLCVGTTSTTGLGGQTGASNVSTFNQAGITLTQYGVTAGFYYDRINFTNSQYFIVNSSGTGVYLGNGNTSFTAHSDERLKTNITELNSVKAYNHVKTARAASFNWNATGYPTDTKIGFIAQDWETNYPEVTDTTSEQIDDVSNPKGIQYTETIPVLMAALKEAIAKIETLETKVAALGG